MNIQTGFRTVNFQDNASLGSVAGNIKTLLFPPFDGMLKKVNLFVFKSGAVSSAADGNFTVRVFKNVANLSAPTKTVVVAGDDFVEKVNNIDGAGKNVYAATFTTDLSVAAGDVIQIQIKKDNTPDLNSTPFAIFT